MSMRQNMVGMVGVLLAATTALAAAPPTAAELIEGLKATEPAARIQAIDGLGSLGAKAADAVNALMPLLQDPAPAVRAHAAHSLGQIGSPAVAAVPTLGKLLADPDKSVRGETVSALGALPAEPAVLIPLLVQAAHDAEPAVRLRAMKALVALGPAAVDPLAKMLADDDLEYWAGLALNELGSAATAAIPSLIEELQDEHLESRREAILALAAMGPKAEAAVAPLTAALDDPALCGAAAYALGCIGPAAAPAQAKLETLSNSEEPMVQTVSVWALARITPEDAARKTHAVQLLAKALTHPQQRIREAAARGLVGLKPEPAVVLPALREAMASADAAQVQNAMDAMASLGELAVPGLIEALEHEPSQVRAAYILGEIGPAAAAAVPALTKLLHADKAEVRREALFALGKIGPAAAAALPDVLACYQSGPAEQRYGAAFALGKLGPAAATAKPALLAGLREPDAFLALASAWALAQVDPSGEDSSAQAVPLLATALQDSEAKIRREAAAALGAFGARAKGAVPALTAAAQDEDPTVREAVAAALQAIGQ